MKNHPKVIIFDVFGTLIKIKSGRSPYRKLMIWLKENGRKPHANDAKLIRSNNVNIQQLAALFGYAITKQLLNEIKEDFQEELKTIELYEDTVSTLQNLKERGYKIALCSNLARPYGEQLKKLIPDLFDFIVFSYEVGYIKPEQQIYEMIQTHFNCDMAEMLFIGDHPILDVEKPLSLGMSARLIQLHNEQYLPDIIDDLIF
ncbi:HAD family hydrolase [Acinetobacter sp. C_4_1]|uniref:HAD family hydrolase n=1 Tax=unclassified Acinetobacter TaxID=196816 RepID=UPI0021B76878|nr:MULTISPECIES: HAD family hydrolase [unclassified Acinetobacter]MCT8088720.1 HAD family hydrolase [Acinetobacter sp. F_3_1]MCT8096876.1 HAD family hydrolase [Acinetobacter sp. C_3_1]MCT8099751.1 HAD family hydrolase [Acinetobacter sp. C_4_1]MCT8133719.1 HAD family hydrolase [Acinetobacter sp. T_3_1]